MTAAPVCVPESGVGRDRADVLRRLGRIEILRALPPEEIQALVPHVGAYCGGEAIGSFADTALRRLGLPTIPTAAALAFFAGISEYIIVYKSHRRGELGIALSNVFGGLTQVMFLLLPCGLILIGVSGLVGAGARFAVPINEATMLLMLLLFPLFYALHQHVEQEKTLSNLDAASMTGIYLLLLYFLFTSPT
ncbi:MAG: hypothetical protein HYS40_08480 [Gemmatimonadetes bacterium]|nr:hypothetical protein [Gemmatimonadota bacterium]